MSRALVPLLASALLAACAGDPERRTLGALRHVEPDVTEVEVENSLDEAIRGYRAFLAEAPESSLTPEAMRRLADLALEKEYGILGEGGAGELPAPEPTREARPAPPVRVPPTPPPAAAESEPDFERRATDTVALAPSGEWSDVELPGESRAEPAGPLEAIALYDEILSRYPTYPHNDQVLYQKARAYDELGRPDEAIAVMEQLIAQHPHSLHRDEVHFRRGEYFFTRRRWLDAEAAYSAITRTGARSEYHELALYKLGWTYYKQDLLEEALDEYVALLDHKVSTGYDFDQKVDEDAERRVADTFRVISLCFSNLGGPEVLRRYFESAGPRSYEDRIYRHLGEFYFEKLRYADAAKAYQAFVALRPLHRASPRFGMRVVEIYEAGGFPKLVLEAKKEFAATYALDSEYWRHFDVAESPEVLAYLKANLVDLASHYHALYQNEELAEERSANFAEATRWYRAALASFPSDPDAPGVNHRLADLLLEHRDFREAAREYERTAYAYAGHAGAAAAGYAAIYAHREQQKASAGTEQEAARREAVESTLRFVTAFPRHEHAARVLGVAVEDLYDMKEYARALATGRQLLEGHPQADVSIRRAAWTVVAHSSFELADYVEAELAYARVLELLPQGDAARAALADNLAASIYKQGEQANTAGDRRKAADHFLRVAESAPSSSIRPAAEYDAAAALIGLEDWAGAAAVLESFRQAHPDHALSREATRQLALVYREQGDLARSAREHERVAAEAEDPELRRESLLVAGRLSEEAKLPDRALAVYLAYAEQFPKPLETAVETRFRIAEMYEAKGDRAARHDQLRRIVAIDREAGSERTDRTRLLAARSALVLGEELYREFAAIALAQPFEQSLREKQRRMDAAIEAFGGLPDYEVGEVTAAATFYLAEISFEFSRSLLESERPRELDPAERDAYETALDEEAFPFEEKSIEVHEKNLELMRAGVHGPWIEKSLAKLAERMPGRYAKPEASSGLLVSLESYVYQPPARPAPATVELAAPAGNAAPSAPVETPPVAEEGTLGPLETVEAAPDVPDATAGNDEVPPPADAADALEPHEAAEPAGSPEGSDAEPR